MSLDSFTHVDVLLQERMFSCLYYHFTFLALSIRLITSVPNLLPMLIIKLFFSLSQFNPHRSFPNQSFTTIRNFSCAAKNLFLLVPIILMAYSAYTSRPYVPELDEETWKELIPVAKPVEVPLVNPHHHDSGQTAFKVKHSDSTDIEGLQGVDINPHRFDGPSPLRFVPLPPGVEYISQLNASTITVAPYSTPPPSLHESCKPNQAFLSSGHPCVPLKGLTRQFIYGFRCSDLTYMMCGIPKTRPSVQIGMMHRMNGKPYAAGGDIHHNENQILINMM